MRKSNRSSFAAGPERFLIYRKIEISFLMGVRDGLQFWRRPTTTRPASSRTNSGTVKLRHQVGSSTKHVGPRRTSATISCGSITQVFGNLTTPVAQPNWTAGDSRPPTWSTLASPLTASLYQTSMYSSSRSRSSSNGPITSKTSPASPIRTENGRSTPVLDVRLVEFSSNSTASSSSSSGSWSA